MGQILVQLLTVIAFGLGAFLLFMDVHEQAQYHRPPKQQCVAQPPPQCRPKQSKSTRRSSKKPKKASLPPEPTIAMSMKIKKDSKTRRVTSRSTKGGKEDRIEVMPGLTMKEKSACKGGRKRQRSYSSSFTENSVTMSKTEKNINCLRKSIKSLRERLFRQKTKYRDLAWYKREHEYFYVSPEKLTWQKAKEHCEEMAADLVSDAIESDENYRFLQTEVFPQYENASLWSGLKLTDGIWKWTDGRSEERENLQPLGGVVATDPLRGRCSVMSKQFPRLLASRRCNENQHHAFCYTNQDGFYISG